MPCKCQGKCTTCACAKKKTPCTDKCHGGQPNHLCLCWDGTVYDPNPKLMNPKQLRQFLAQHSLSPMGNKTELLLRTRDYLEAQKSTSSSSSSSSSTSTSSSSSTSSSGGDVKLSGKETMAKIIDLHDNYEAILSIAGTEITKDSGTSVMRRAYLKISMKVHPDKNGQSAESKNAFQLLVSAYERLSQPELYMEEDAKSTGPKQARLSRSNHGCTITRLDCPRCHMQWNKAELGLEKAAYNFMMQGIKLYACGRCLMQFGCFSGIHKCPHCAKPFEYDVNDFHRKVTCGNDNCPKKFGFWMHHVSERRENQIRQEVKKDQEDRLKKREQRGGRSARAALRKRNAAASKAKADAKKNAKKKKAGSKKSSSSSSSKIELTEDEKAFVLGLIDDCPKCGRAVRGNPGELALREHLNECNDADKHKKYQKKKAKNEKKQASVASVQDNQEEMMLEKQWEYQGCQAGQLWMLSENSLRRQLENRGLPTDGELHELIARLAPLLRIKEKGRYLMQDGEAAGDVQDKSNNTNGKGATEFNLPTNMQTMSARQLRAVAASVGVKVKANDAKVDIIDALERARFKELAPGLMLADHPNEDGVKKNLKRKASSSEDDSDSDVDLPSPIKPLKKKKIEVIDVDEDSDEDIEGMD